MALLSVLSRANRPDALIGQIGFKNAGAAGRGKGSHAMNSSMLLMMKWFCAELLLGLAGVVRLGTRG